MSVGTRTSDLTKNEFFVGFNQDCTSLAVSTTSGYRILSLNSIDSLREICEDETEDICIVERLFSSSLLAIVSLSSPRKLKVCHFKKGTEICNYSYSNTILAVKLNRARLIVCLEESLYIHNIRDMKVLHTIRDTPPNPAGLCALSTDSDNCFLAYPGSSTIGEVQIFDTVNLHCKMMIAAHDSPLAALVFSPSGELIATASEKGTVIRVFNVTDGNKLFEFRRGVKRCVNISGLAFSPDATFLAVASNTETVHVFKLDDPKNVTTTEETGQGWMGYLSKAASISANYLPTQVTGVFTQGRAFSTAHLPFHTSRNICALTMIEKVLRLLVASSDGTLYVCNFNPNEGGDCTIIKQHKLIKRPEISNEIVHGEGSHAAHPDTKDHPNAESEKQQEMENATRKPEKGSLKLDDEAEFPPVTLNND